MWKWVCLVLVASPAFAGSKRLVDASVVYRRSIEDTTSETDSRDTACVSTKTTTITFTLQAQVVAAKVPIFGTSFELPNTKEAKLSGQAHYDYKAESHSSSCQGKTDFNGTAQGNADAKDIRVSGNDEMVTISPKFGEPKSEGTLVQTPSKGAVVKQDGAKLAASQAAMYESGMGIAALASAQMIGMMTKSSPHWLDTEMTLAQDKPVVVQTNG